MEDGWLISRWRRILSWVPAKNNFTPRGMKRRRAKYRDEYNQRATSSFDIYRVPLGQRQLETRLHFCFVSVTRLLAVAATRSILFVFLAKKRLPNRRENARERYNLPLVFDSWDCRLRLCRILCIKNFIRLIKLQWTFATLPEQWK